MLPAQKEVHHDDWSLTISIFFRNHYLNSKHGRLAEGGAEEGTGLGDSEASGGGSGEGAGKKG